MLGFVLNCGIDIVAQKETLGKDLFLMGRGWKWMAYSMNRELQHLSPGSLIINVYYNLLFKVYYVNLIYYLLC